MDIVKVDIDSFRRVPAHEGEALGSQAIRTGSVGAFVPFDTCEINPVMIGYSVKAASNSCTARSGSPVAVDICFIDVGVVVEILVQVS